MDDSIAKGLLLGLMLGIIGLIADLVRRLIRSRSEGTRRFKVVASIGLLLALVSLMISTMGPIGAIGTSLVIAAIVWIFKGYKVRKAVPVQQPQSKSFTSVKPTVDATDLKKNIRVVGPDKKTVISCANCASQLRVVAGKYIDVTCPYCKTVFRTHT